MRPVLTYFKKWEDPLFKGVTFCFALLILLLTLFIAFALFYHALPAIKKFGVSFLWGTTWDPVSEQFGALPFLYGTLMTSAIAIIISVPIGLGVSIFLSEISPRWLSNPISYLVDLLAAIPSVIYGIIGLYLLVPFMREEIYPALSYALHFLPIFQGAFYGLGIFTAGILLSLMILPFIISVSREVMLSVPQTQREAILSLGATRWEMVSKVVIPLSRSGIIGSVFLALARALGEATAVTMVIGNNPIIPSSFFDPGHAMAAVISSEFSEATSDLYLSALIEIGLILFLVSFIMHGVARMLVPTTVRAT